MAEARAVQEALRKIERELKMERTCSCDVEFGAEDKSACPSCRRTRTLIALKKQGVTASAVADPGVFDYEATRFLQACSQQHI